MRRATVISTFTALARKAPELNERCATTGIESGQIAVSVVRVPTRLDMDASCITGGGFDAAFRTLVAVDTGPIPKPATVTPKGLGIAVLADRRSCVRRPAQGLLRVRLQD